MDLRNFVLNQPFLKKIELFFSKIPVPFITGVSVWDLIKIYLDGLMKGALGFRAASISWWLFIGLIPLAMLSFVLMQYLPHYEEVEVYFYQVVIRSFVPNETYPQVSDYIAQRSKIVNESFDKQGWKMLSISSLAYIYIATRGIRSLISGMQSTNSMVTKKRSGIKLFQVSLFLTLFLTIINLGGLLLIYYTKVIWQLFLDQSTWIQEYLSHFSDWVTLFAYLIIVFSALCVIYYYGPKNKLRFKEVLPGAILTTILFIGIGYLYGIYLSTSITRYNLIYGSFGSILLLMLMLYVYVILILIGYELNIAILKAKKKRVE